MKEIVTIVTGGSSGIGRCAAIALQQAGCKVYEFSRRNNPIEGVQHIGVDVTDQVSINTAVDQIIGEYDKIDILINCAGNGISGAVEFIEFADAKQTLSAYTENQRLFAHCLQAVDLLKIRDHKRCCQTGDSQELCSV